MSVKRVNKDWKMKVVDGEDVILTIHQNGVPDATELNGHRYKVVMRNGAFSGFLDSADGSMYKNPSILCRTKFHREGVTNEWRGPRHCLVHRNGSWIPIGNL